MLHELIRILICGVVWSVSQKYTTMELYPYDQCSAIHSKGYDRMNHPYVYGPLLSTMTVANREPQMLVSSGFLKGLRLDGLSNGDDWVT